MRRAQAALRAGDGDHGLDRKHALNHREVRERLDAVHERDQVKHRRGHSTVRDGEQRAVAEKIRSDAAGRKVGLDFGEDRGHVDLEAARGLRTPVLSTAPQCLRITRFCLLAAGRAAEAAANCRTPRARLDLRGGLGGHHFPAVGPGSPDRCAGRRGRGWGHAENE